MVKKKRPLVTKKLIFKVGQNIVYPAHGVGTVVDIEMRKVGETEYQFYVVDIEVDTDSNTGKSTGMTVRIPTYRAEDSGMRALADEKLVLAALTTLRGKAKIKRTMWSRRAQEYETKINSGSLISIAEVIRDLYRSEGQPDQSYSERKLFENAKNRMARELMAAKNIDRSAAKEIINESLADKLPT